MSAFEHYAMGIPMFVPSHKLLVHWKNSGRNVLSELEFPNNINSDLDDEWIGYADWYDTNNMPGVMIFDSVEHLKELLNTYDRTQITNQMKEFYKVKKQNVLNLWKETL
jgi:hypothetical protein